jgi:leucyl aminopeptidase
VLSILRGISRYNITNMRLSIIPLLWLLPAVLSVRIPASEQVPLHALIDEGKHLLEFPTGETQWVTEDEKWELKRDGQFFMDITAFRDLGSFHTKLKQKNKFPTAVAQKENILPLLEDLTGANIKANLEQFTSFHNRFYRSEYGAKSAKWLLDLISSTIKEAGADDFGVTVTQFDHEWAQHSIILSIPGKSNSTVVVGAHQDSANYEARMDGRAPGADDDGSGTMTILEVLRVLLTSRDILEGKAENTIEFHWYSAEEAGLLGSQDVFRHYEKTGRDIKAMLQQDMTGFTNLTVEAGRKPEFGLLVDLGTLSLPAFDP